MSAPSSGGSDRTANRAAGLALVGFAALLWFLVIPAQVDTASYGWMRPRTLPSICAVALGLFGAVIAAWPLGAVDLAPGRTLRVATLLGLSGLALWAMGRFGFPWTAPVFAAALVAVLGERRWPWILAAVAVVPAAIWLVVVAALGRTLP